MPYLIRLLADIATTVVRYQDRDSGLWFEVIDQPARQPGNYLESSGTAMFVYALAKGVNHGYLDRRFSVNAVRGYSGLIARQSREGPGRALELDRYSAERRFGDASGVASRIAAAEPARCLRARSRWVSRSTISSSRA